MDYYDAALAETRRFSAEMNRLTADTTARATAEARKFDRERWAVYAAAVGGVVGGAAGLVSLLRAAG